MSPELEQRLKAFNRNEREFFEERAAILEYDAGYSRDQAEKLAYFATLEYFEK